MTPLTSSIHPSEPLLLRDADVHALLDMPTTIDTVEAALRRQAIGQATNRPRQRVPAPASHLHVMAAGDRSLGVFGIKVYSSAAAGARFLVLLYSEADGELLAVIEADRLGQMRTGAASGVATKYMARRGAASVGILGTGWQAESQLQAVCAVRPIRTVKAYSRHADRRNRFAERMSEHLGVAVTPVGTPEEAVRGQELVITATSAREPVCRGAWLEPGAHVNAVGANFLSRRELDVEAVARAAVVAVDSAEQCRLEAGDLLPAVERGVLTWESLVEVGRIADGQVPGRRTEQEITLFKSLGIALEDVATAWTVYELAKSQGVGKRIALWRSAP